MKFFLSSCVCVLSLLFAVQTSAQTIQTGGSTTLLKMAKVWAKEYRKANPDIQIKVGGGSGSGIVDLIDENTKIANASRKAIPAEKRQAVRQGQALLEHIVSYDAVAFYVNENNPVGPMHLKQLANIYAQGKGFERWKDVGVRVPGCEGNNVLLVQRPDDSGTYGYVKKQVLKNQPYKDAGRLIWGARDVVNLVGQEPCGIGYSSLGYDNPFATKLCISRSRDGECFVPSIATVQDRSYPLSRPLLMYTRGSHPAQSPLI